MRTGLTIIAAGLALTLAGATPARQTQPEPKPCAGESSPLSAKDLRALRVAKAEYIVKRLYNYPDRRSFLPYVSVLVNEHEYLEAYAVSKGKPGQGYADAYFWSLVYGAANFELKCYTSAPGNCEGPLDVKGKRGSRDPKTNIAYHTQEMLQGYLQGYRGRRLCEYVMYPADPRSWGYKWDKKLGRRVGRFEATEIKMRACIAEGYASGELGARSNQN